jgi:hypothetical protein
MLLQVPPILPNLVKPAPDLQAPPGMKTKYQITTSFFFILSSPCLSFPYNFTPITNVIQHVI